MLVWHHTVLYCTLHTWRVVPYPCRVCFLDDYGGAHVWDRLVRRCRVRAMISLPPVCLRPAMIVSLLVHHYPCNALVFVLKLPNYTVPCCSSCCVPLEFWGACLSCVGVLEPHRTVAWTLCCTRQHVVGGACRVCCFLPFSRIRVVST